MSMLASRYGAMAGVKLTQVLHLKGSGGYYVNTGNTSGRLWVKGMFHTQPGMFYSTRASGGQTLTGCTYWERFYNTYTGRSRYSSGSLSTTYPITTTFPINEWHEYNFQSGYISMSASKDGICIKSCSGTEIGYTNFTQSGGYNVDWLHGVEMYIAEIRIYSINNMNSPWFSANYNNTQTKTYLLGIEGIDYEFVKVKAV